MNVFLSVLLIFFSSYSYSQTFTLQDSAFHIGDVLRTHLYFDFMRAEIRPDSKPFLDSLGHFLKIHPEIKMEISCHSRGSKLYSRCITRQRADSITSYLIHNHKIDKSRLIPRGYEGDKPLISEAEINKLPKEKQLEAHWKNRRTEFTIIELLK